MNQAMPQPATARKQRAQMRPFPDTQSTDDPGPSTTATLPLRADGDLFQHKLARLREFVEQALANSDPRLAALGIPEEAVLRMLVRIDDMIDRLLSDPAPDASRCAELQPLLAEMLRCAAVAQRFAHLRLAFSDLVRSSPESR